MISAPTFLAGSIVAEIALQEVATPSVANLPTLLSLLEGGFLVLSTLLLAHTAFQARRPQSALRLVGAPDRRHHFGEEAVVVIVAVYLSAAGVASVLVSRHANPSENPLASLLIGMTAHGSGMAACLLTARWRCEGGVPGFVLGEDRRAAGRHIRLAVILSVVAVGFCPLIHHVTVAVIRFVDPTFSPSAHPTINALHDAQTGTVLTILFWSSAMVTAPIAEELFFRGVLQSFLTALLRSRWRGIALSALCFGLVHMPQPHAIPALVFLGLVIGYAYERTGSLVPPILMHMLFNLKTLVWDSLGAGSP